MSELPVLLDEIISMQYAQLLNVRFLATKDLDVAKSKYGFKSMDDVLAIRDADNLVLNRLARETVIFSADSIRSGAIKSAVNSLSVAQANKDVGLKPHDYLAHSTSIRLR